MNTESSNRNSRKEFFLFQWIEDEFMFRKLNSVFGFFFLGALSLVCCALIVHQPFPKGFVIPGGILALAMLMVCFANGQYGFMLMFFFSFLPAILFRLTHADFPFGSVPDVLCLVILAGLSLTNKASGINTKINYWNPVTVLLLLNLLVYGMEILNPSKGSVSGWFMIFRKQAAFVLPYFIFLQIFTSLKALGSFLKFWIFMGIITALYGFYQQIFGFTAIDLSNVDQESLAGLFVEGQIKRFSFLADPSVFGVFMSITAILCLILSQGPYTAIKKFGLLSIAVICLFGAVYSGTRTAYAIIPAGLVFYILLTIYKRTTIIFAIVFTVLFAAIIFGPFYGNGSINRIRSAFVGSKDASFNVRTLNRKRIQPFIYSHPIGGGLLSTGGDGEKFAPGNPLAGFPPDGAYMKSALETGWVGLLVLCAFYFAVMRSFTFAYFRAKTDRVRNYLAAIGCCIFALTISQLTQEVVNEIPVVVIFYGLLAVPIRILDFETSAQEEPLNAKASSLNVR